MPNNHKKNIYYIYDVKNDFYKNNFMDVINQIIIYYSDNVITSQFNINTMINKLTKKKNN